MNRDGTPNPHTASRRRTDSEDSEAHAHRRRADSDAVLHLHGRVADCEQSIRQLLESHREMALNMKSLNLNLGRVADVLEALGNLKGFWWTMKLMSTFAKAAIPLLALAGAIWLFIRTGQWNG